MPLAPEMVYNDLNGEEVKEILLTRFADLLNKVPDFQRHLIIPRVKMRLNVQLEVHGRNPPSFTITDDLTIRMRAGETQDLEPELFDLTAEVNADSGDPSGQPPDQVREEHGLPVMEPRKGPFGIEDHPVVHEDGIKYARFVTQDRGGPVIQGHDEYQDAPILPRRTPLGPVAPVQPDFKENVIRKPGERT